MKKLNTKPLSGTRDFLPREVKARENVFGAIKQVFESFGFQPIDTPALERVENLIGKYGDEGEKLIFKILKRGEQAASGEADIALRYDLTVPFARFFAEHQNELPRVFRRYQIGPVWRADRPGKGRFREFYQCDIDIIGSVSLLADAEVIIALSRTLSRLGLCGYKVCLNSRKVLAGLIEIYGVSESESRSLIIALDKLDKVGIAGVAKELKSRGLPAAVVGRLTADISKPKAEIRKKIKASPIAEEGLAEVDEISSLVAPFLKDGEIEFSPFLCRGLDYYTGPIFEIYLKSAPGAIASGGRYDNLIAMFAGKQIPACGGSLGIDRLLSTIKAGVEKKDDLSKPQVFVTVWNDVFRKESLAIASELRDNGIVAEISLDEGKIDNQIRFASKRGASHCLFYGPDEQTKKEVKLKNLSTGEQKSVRREELAKTLKDILSTP
ncbi:MAG: histidyl-tRNA synthetase [Parcubacteria group bacterium Licking1014_1]|nr:MAG: histidyl-tRNA synthetase [Parcubacteria group bacterium Licking1014_1]